MRVETIQLQVPQGKSLPIFLKGGFYNAVVQEQTGKNLFALKINGQVVTAASELPLQVGEQLFMRVKTLNPLPVLELVTMQKLLPKLLNTTESRVAVVIKNILQGRLPSMFVDAEDSMITKEFLKEQVASQLSPLPTLITGDNDTDIVLRHARIQHLVQQEYGEKGMFFMSFPYIENKEVHDGYFSYTPASNNGMEEYRIMAELSVLGTVLAVVRQWKNTVGIHLYTELEKSAFTIRESFQVLRTALHTAGIVVASLTVKQTGIVKDPLVMLAFACDEGVDVVV